MIPKVINYIWIGDKTLPDRESLCIESWKRVLPDYKIIEYGNQFLESLPTTPLLESFKRKKKWAFLSDYMRLFIMKYYPGIYLDTDIFMIKPFTDEMLSYSFFAGMGEEHVINQGVMGSDGTFEALDRLINHYKELNEKFEQSPVEYTSTICQALNYSGEVGITTNSLEFFDKNAKLYARDYFYPVHWSGNSYKRKLYLNNRFTDNTICMHLWTASAQPPSNHNWVSNQIRESQSEIYEFLKFNKVDQYFLDNFDKLIKRG